MIYRIKAIKDFSAAKAGDLGGFVESESNLSHEGDCWISGNARVYAKAKVTDNARIYGEVCDNAMVNGTSRVCGKVMGNANIYDEFIDRGEVVSSDDEDSEKKLLS